MPKRKLYRGIKPAHPVLLRDEQGRFMKQAERYTPKLHMIQAWRGGSYVDLGGEGGANPKTLADILSGPEFESLKEAIVPLKEFKTRAKYQAWDIADQIDQTPGLRRKDLRIDVTIRDGQRKRVIPVYYKIKRNTSSSYRIFQRINEEMGFLNMNLYKAIRGKIIADRRGRTVTIEKVVVNQII